MDTQIQIRNAGMALIFFGAYLFIGNSFSLALFNGNGPFAELSRLLQQFTEQSFGILLPDISLLNLFFLLCMAGGFWLILLGYQIRKFRFWAWLSVVITTALVLIAMASGAFYVCWILSKYGLPSFAYGIVIFIALVNAILPALLLGFMLKSGIRAQFAQA